MQVQPYLFFDGRCDEAMDFYKGAVGAKVSMLMRYKECPDKSMLKAGTEDKVMHAQFQVGDTSILASDGHCNGNTNFQGFSLAISAKTEAEAEKMFGALSSGGQVQMPLTKTFFSPKFGMLADKFGVGWMILVAQ
jgi:PhnB protein